MNKRTFSILLSTVLLLSGPAAYGDTFSFTDNLAIPDGEPAGVSDVQAISTSITQITSLQVSLNIAGNFNGDLYCYLQYDGTLSVLLNRVGRSVSNPFGYADSGFAVTFSDTAANGNIHTYQLETIPANGTPLTGLWQPDGRTTSPATVLNTDPGTANLSQFNGLNPNGNWTLFVADLSPGGTSELLGWQLTVNPVPEPSGSVLMLIGLGVLLLKPFRKAAI
jgi:subtilisin-like proprotein convertase family protein